VDEATVGPVLRICRARWTRTEQWDQERARISVEARTAAHDTVVRQGRGAPQRLTLHIRRRGRAVEAFERRNPPPTFDGNASPKSWFSRAAEKLGEAVRVDR
jgi:hypothetical protein